MSEEKLLPLGSKLAHLIAAERRAADPSSDPQRADRIFERLATSVALGAPGAVAAAATAAATSTGATAASSAGTALSKKVVIVASAFLLGGGTGAALHAHYAPASTSTQVATTTNEPPAVTPATSAGVEEEPSHGPAIDGGAPARSIVRSADSLGDRDLDLSRERSLIDRARMASARSAPAEELAALDEHARLFPRGRLAEEREALAVGALSAQGRETEARERGDGFKKRYPMSVFLPAVEALLERQKNDAAP